MDQLSNGVDNERDPCQVFKSLMAIVGCTIRTGPQDKRAQLLHKLRQPLDAGLRGSPEGLSHEGSDSETFASSDQGRFASALNEYGQQQGGFVPTYHYEAGGKYATGCIAVVTCGKLTFRAPGRSKKRARHAAAYQACLYYRVAP
jgi:hypothetical protein